MSEEETPQERFARLRAKSPLQFTKPKPLHEALLDVSLADYERLRSVVEATATVDDTILKLHNIGYLEEATCPHCHANLLFQDPHEEDCITRVGKQVLEQLPPARPQQLPPL